MIDYTQLTLRNAGYISPDLQERIRKTRLLIAGCGLGSVAAEVALRTGFERLDLVDGDVVDTHNLNRQIYQAADVGRPKVECLAERLKAVYPGADVAANHGWLTADTVRATVERADLIFDTIDFLDLPAIIALHDEARRQGKTVISAFSVGWGSLVTVFTPQSATLRDLGGLATEGSVEGASYPLVFRALLERLADRLPRDFVEVTWEALSKMADGKPCPAPQLGAGAYATAAAMTTAAVRLLAGKPVAVAPDIILLDVGASVSASALRVEPRRS